MKTLTQKSIENEIYDPKFVALLTILTCVFIWISFRITIFALPFAVITFVVMDFKTKISNMLSNGEYYIIQDEIKKKINNTLIECNFGKLTIGKKAKNFNTKDKVFLVILQNPNIPIMIYNVNEYKLDNRLQKKIYPFEKIK